MAVAVNFVATDRISLVFPADVDANIGAIGITFKLRRDLNG